MKYIIRSGALALCFSLLVTCLGCTPALTPTPSSAPVSAPSQPQTVTQTQIETHELTIDYNQYWAWTDLYDYLENPLASDKLAFNSDQHEYALLYEADGVTPITDWKQPLASDMLVVEYTADGREIRRLRIRIINQPTSSAPAVSVQQPASTVSSRPAVSSPSHHAVSSQPTSSAAVPSQLVITMSGPNIKSLKKAAEAFTRSHPQISVKVAETQQLYTAAQLAAQQSEQSLPHIVMMNQTEMALAAKQGLLLALPFGGNDDRFAHRLTPVCLTNAAVEDVYYGAPIGYSTYAFACNDEILYRCGETMPATFEELLDSARQVKETLPGITPIGFATNPADQNTIAREFAMLLFSFGGNLFASDGSASAFYSVEGTQTVQFYKKLKHEELLQPQQSYADFWDGKTAFSLVCSESYSQTFGKRAKGNFSPIAFMMPGSQPAVSYLNLYSYCIPQGGSLQEKEAAMEFLNFYFSNPVYNLADCKLKDWIPALEEAAKDDYYSTPAWKVFRLAAQSARTPDVLDCTETVNGYLAQAVAAALAGEDENAVLAKAKEKTDLRLQRNS